MTLVGRVDLWLPPIALMALLFYLSAQPDLSSGLGDWDFVLRKIGHATVYAVLCLLWWRALRGFGMDGGAVVAAFLITVAYGISDEWHQSFVETRHGSPVDVLIDTAGAGVAAIFAARRSS